MSQHAPQIRYRSRYAKRGSANVAFQAAGIALVVVVLALLAMVLLSNA